MANHILRQTIANHAIGRAKNLIQPIKMSQSFRPQSISASKLVFAEYGEPVNVIQKQDEELPPPKPHEVVVKMLAAPVNPADINTIQGTYAVKPPLPAVGGNEGVGEVIQKGKEVTDFQLGDHVVPLKNSLGTWRTHVVLERSQLFKIPKEIGIVEAATFTVNPATAYRMVKDFVKLKPQDVVIQNGANSACGQYAIQLCREWGIDTVNVVRDRPNINELKSSLQALGATEVLTEEELRVTDLFKSKKLSKPRLALNCVGGKSATELLRQLENGGTMVTYGGMSREPVTVAISSLIFKDVSVRGFWMTRWSNQNAFSEERFKMFTELIELMKNGKLKGPSHEMIPFENYKVALENTLNPKGMAGKKYILKF